jgi:hypothetical protein
MTALDPLRSLAPPLDCRTMTNARSIVLMLLGPPVVLWLWAHLIRPSWPGLDWPVTILAGLLGFVGVAIAPWRTRTKIIVGAAYVALAIALLPFVGLLAVCSTGDCL